MSIARVAFASLLLLAAALPGRALAQDEAPAPAPAADEGPATGFTLGLNQDNFFGFYGTVQATVELSPGLHFSAYSIIWTTPSFAQGAPSGFGLWTEAGAGVVFELLDGGLSVNPQLGILNGVLLSGSNRALAFEGIVPNVTANYSSDLFMGQLYAGYYLGLRDERPGDPNDFLHYWLNFGVNVLPFLAAGLHWEQLVNTRGGAAGADGNVYMWLGIFAEVAVANFALRFTAGVDLIDVGDDVPTTPELSDFYKLNAVATF